MSEIGKFTNKEYWNRNLKDEVGGLKFFKFSKLGLRYKRFLSTDSSKECIEIGGFPGRYIGSFAKEFKYKPTVLDFLDDLDFVKANMEFNGIHDCEIINEDFTTWKSHKKYDVVLSFGFVEHFKNYEEIIKKHVDIMKNGGLLVLAVPNYFGVQLWLRKLLFTKEAYKETMDAHNRQVMNLKELKRVLFANLKLTKLFAGYVGGMTIYLPDRKVRLERKWLYNFYRKIITFVYKLFYVNLRAISPTILIIGEKQKNREI